MDTTTSDLTTGRRNLTGSPTRYHKRSEDRTLPLVPTTTPRKTQKETHFGRHNRDTTRALADRTFQLQTGAIVTKATESPSYDSDAEVPPRGRNVRTQRRSRQLPDTKGHDNKKGERQNPFQKVTKVFAQTLCLLNRVPVKRAVQVGHTHNKETRIQEAETIWSLKRH